MREYMLLLYDSPTGAPDLSPEEMQRIIEKYQAWSEKLRSADRYVGGSKLTDGDGRVVRRDDDGVRVLDGPYSETKEVVGGYMAIRADSYQEAVELCRDCPHLGFGGTIEIREIETQ